MLAEMQHSSAGTVRSVKSPMGLSATPLERYVAPPTLGEHTKEILTDLLRYSEREFDQLRREKVV
jgi:crotonobetainyl-CoA:carnitine CoA-transferase CaiB-like acyl-CoA transferase